MKIYNYEKTSGAFVSEGVADESPLEPGVLLMPANSTSIAPPKYGAFEIPVFSEGKWRVVPDYRGMQYYKPDGIPVVIHEIGKKPEPEWVTEFTMPTISEAEEASIKGRAFLAETDWYVIRFIETGKEIPGEIKSARAAARLAIVE